MHFFVDANNLLPRHNRNPPQSALIEWGLESPERPVEGDSEQDLISTIRWNFPLLLVCVQRSHTSHSNHLTRALGGLPKSTLPHPQGVRSFLAAFLTFWGLALSV